MQQNALKKKSEVKESRAPEARAPGDRVTLSIDMTFAQRSQLKMAAIQRGVSLRDLVMATFKREGFLT